MWFKKSEPTIESLSKQCNEGYRNFIFHISQAHGENYFLFKMQLKDDLLYLRHKIAHSQSEEQTLALLRHFKQQMDFVNKNPFMAEVLDFDKFLAANYPYKEKVDALCEQRRKQAAIKV